MRVTIIPNRFYPCYQYAPVGTTIVQGSKVVDLLPEEIAMIDDAFSEFVRWQRFLAGFYKNGNDSRGT